MDHHWQEVYGSSIPLSQICPWPCKVLTSVFAAYQPFSGKVTLLMHKLYYQVNYCWMLVMWLHAIFSAEIQSCYISLILYSRYFSQGIIVTFFAVKQDYKNFANEYLHMYISARFPHAFVQLFLLTSPHSTSLYHGCTSATCGHCSIFKNSYQIWRAHIFLRPASYCRCCQQMCPDCTTYLP